MTRPRAGPQDAVLAFLMRPDTYREPGPVTHVETHGAHVFLCGGEALKIKRAVRFDYMDLSTPALRHGFLERELVRNRGTAPDFYRDVVAITRRADGGLELDGGGPPVEWVLRMHRFAKECEMTEVARNGQLTDAVAEALGRSIWALHQGCAVSAEPADGLMREILDELGRVFAGFADRRRVNRALGLLAEADRDLAAQSAALHARTAAGWVRRVHGDLHLGNLLLIDGQPRTFDALEFDDRLATSDVLYDLAFLLMDLCHRGLGRQANATMNAYLLAADGGQDGALSTLPLFLAVRAMIRAMVLMQTADLVPDKQGGAAILPEVDRYLDAAEGFLRRPPCRLVLVGGLSGSGKTVLARSLAPMLGPCPGAVHLRSDTERKRQATGPAYDAAARAAVYVRLLARAGVILGAGRDVVLDATFLDPRQRDAARAMAREGGLGFCGLWLAAPEAVLFARVAARSGDASDADAAVLRRQIAAGDKPPETGDGWVVLDAAAPQGVLLQAATASLSLPDPPMVSCGPDRRATRPG